MPAPVLNSLPYLVLAFGAIEPSFAAVCNPSMPDTRRVGNTSTDTACTDDTIQAAIDNAVCPNTTIYITQERSYSAQHLTIQDESLALIGVATSCGGAGAARPAASPDAVPTAPIVTLDGAGNGGTSVLAVRGSGNLLLQFLELTHGSGGAGSHGGGIDFQGAGTLTLDTTTVDGNSANFGGGIGFSGIGASANLILNAYTVIESNTASGNGGGIDIEGSADLRTTQPFTRIHGNQALNGNGGGVAVVSPARADIGSPGYNAVGILDGNAAAFGGGISGQVTNQDELVMNFFSADARHPVTLSNNFASQGGGALYVLPHGSGLAVACLSDFRIAGNTSPEGAAILVDADVSAATPATAYLEFNALNFVFCPNALAHATCAPDVSCNVVEGNVNADGASQPQPGATITQRANFIGEFGAGRFAMRGNTGMHAVQAIDSTASLNNCLIADNTYSAAALSSENRGNGAQPPTFAIDSCTLANNAPGSGSVIHTEYDLTLSNSIIDQPAMPALSTGGAALITVRDMLVADAAGLPPQADIVAGEPAFTAPARGDYRLRAIVQNGVVTASSGIDFAPPGNGEADLAGNPHDQDIPSVMDHFGNRDLGCCEAQLIVDRIFADTISDPVTIVR